MKKQKEPFKGGGFYNVTAGVERNSMLNRAIIDVGGVMPWLLMCNNKDERRERTADLLLFFSLAFLAPVLTVPAANRFAMKHISKRTKSRTAFK